MSRHKELSVRLKAIQQTEFVGQLKNSEGLNADGTQSMVVLTISKKIIETCIKFSQGSVTVL